MGIIIGIFAVVALMVLFLPAAWKALMTGLTTGIFQGFQAGWGGWVGGAIVVAIIVTVIVVVVRWVASYSSTCGQCRRSSPAANRICPSCGRVKDPASS